jgi:hypothetical protein
MDTRARNRVAFANYAVAAGIAAWGAYLSLMPLYPSDGDSHGGLLAVFSGLFLVAVALVPFCAGRLVRFRSRAAWPVQVLALALVVGLFGYAIQ